MDVKGAKTLGGPFKVCRTLFSVQEDPAKETWRVAWVAEETHVSALVGAHSGEHWPRQVLPMCGERERWGIGY